MVIQIPRGTQDILPGQSEKWQYVEQVARDLCRLYQYEEIRTPMFESTDLFVRGVGDTTDIVQKEMYTFPDKSDRSLTLRPEGTSPVVRSYIGNKMHGHVNQPVKLFYLAPVFRYERPGAGRYRQHHQFGAEVLGSEDPAVDAEMISLAVHFFETLGLKNLRVAVNSLGDTESRMQYRQNLVAHFESRIGEFCSDCQRRLEQNPLRILDCKVDQKHELIATAPSILDHLNEYSADYFAKVQQYLQAMGVEVVIDATLVRGLDYYNHTVFEVMFDSQGFGANATLSGGGRYNGLVEQLGGPPVSAVGFGLGLERLLLALEAEGIQLPIEKTLDCYLVSFGEQAKDETVKLLHQLRKAGFSCERDYLDKKPKAQLKAADRLGAKYVIMIGDDEITAGTVSVKNMQTTEQETVLVKDLVEFLKKGA